MIYLIFLSLSNDSVNRNITQTNLLFFKEKYKNKYTKIFKMIIIIKFCVKE